jgi:hypothetical protein
VAIVPCGVRTPSTPRVPISKPVAGVFGAGACADLLRRAAVADGSSDGSTLQSVGLHGDGGDAALAQDRQPAPRLAVEMKSIATPTSRPARPRAELAQRRDRCARS